MNYRFVHVILRLILLMQLQLLVCCLGQNIIRGRVVSPLLLRDHSAMFARQWHLAVAVLL